MDKIGAQYVLDLRNFIYNKNFDEYKKDILWRLDRQILNEILEFLRKLQPDEYLVLSQPEYRGRTNLLPYETGGYPNLTLSLELKTDIVKERPYLLTTLKYKEEIVMPLEELTLWQRVKFVLTGEYPK